MAGGTEVTGADRPDRVAVWGAPASGKTTLAQRLATALGAAHLEMDAVHWQPGWVPLPTEEFRTRVAQFAAGERWVVDGEYFTKAADLIEARADMVVWLDYGLPLLEWRLLWRTVGRVWRHEVLWNGNRETLRGALFSRDSLLLYLLRGERRKRRARERRAADLAVRGVRVVRLRSPRAAERWLTRAEAAAAQAPRG